MRSRIAQEQTLPTPRRGVRLPTATASGGGAGPHRQVGLHDVEQLGHDRAHAAEVGRAALAAQPQLQPLDGDERLVGRVAWVSELIEVRGLEDDVRGYGFQLAVVAGWVPVGVRCSRREGVCAPGRGAQPSDGASKKGSRLSAKSEPRGDGRVPRVDVKVLAGCELGRVDVN